jgi:AGZA family xanthine/uracil permease-like MFS transporter
MLNRLFRLSSHGTTVRTEVVAGLTTFASMASTLAILPAVLSVTGMDRPALVTAVAISGALMTIVMALATNYPIVLATGMGIGSFLAYNICGTMGIPWPAALGLVFYAGVLFLLLSISGIREMLVRAIPRELKLAIPCGIGLFITLIGLEDGGIVRGNPATFIALGNVANPACLLVLLGLVLTAVLIWWEVRGAIIISVLVITGLGLAIPASSGGRMITQLPASIAGWPASLHPLLFKLDLGYLWSHLLEGSTVILAILFIDLFDNMGTLIGVCSRAGLLDKDGHLPKMKQAFMADACAAMVAACLGTSTVTSVIQSATGVEAGGRTGLTAITAAFALVLALFLTPLILAVPAVATAPALIVMGAFMLQGINELDLSDLGKTIPAFVTIVMMPFSFSILEGIGLGLITYVGFMVGTARAREVPAATYVLSLLFLIHYLH